MTARLPEGWDVAPIGTVARVVGGGTPPSHDPDNFAPAGHGIPWLTPADLSGYRSQSISRGARDLSEAGLARCGATLMPKGTVLFSSRAPIGYVAIAANEISTNQGFKSFVLPAEIDPRFVYWQLKHLKPEAEAIATGTTFKELSGAAAATLPLRIAPVPEQTRIADQLDTLLARIQACQDRLEAIPALLKRFRQAVLDAAIDGSLTAEWREGRSSPDWAESTVGACGVVSGGLTKNSRRESAPLRRPYLRVANVQAGRLELDDVAEIGLTEAEFSKTSLRAGDLLIVEGNGSLEKVGRVAMWSGQIENCVHQNHLIRWRSNGPSPHWVLTWLLSSTGRSALMERASTTTGLYTLSISKVSSVPIRLPGYEEQEEIIRRVSALHQFAERTFQRYSKAVAHSQRLGSLTLSKAFRGELIPQDPNDEPASALLARIAAQRNASAHAAHPARRGRPPRTAAEPGASTEPRR